MNIAVTSQLDDVVSTVYGELRAMAASFAFKPGERINESALSRELGASRTPLREALNRLAAEGFVEYRTGHGFYCRDLSAARIRHLYQARMAIECEALRHATANANDDTLAVIYKSLDETADEYAMSGDAERMLALDEAFHLDLVRLAENPELLRMLSNVYDKIRFVRTADLRMLHASGRTTIDGHKGILDLVSTGDATLAANAMRSHIEHRTSYATEAVRRAFADLYAPQS